MFQTSDIELLNPKIKLNWITRDVDLDQTIPNVELRAIFIYYNTLSFKLTIIIVSVSDSFHLIST